MNLTILKTLTFFDLFSYPLTPLELWRYASAKHDVAQYLQSPELADIPNKHGFYHLPGRADLVATRQERYALSLNKFKKARRAASFFSFLPWVKFVALVNQIGTHNLRVEGDLDFFIITAPKRLWLSRLVIVTCLKIFGLRPRANHNQDKLCLSFWLTSDNLNLNAYRLPVTDLYFTYWLACLWPLIDKNGSYQKLISANSWLKDELPNWQPVQPKKMTLPQTDKSTWRLFDVLDKLAYRAQLKFLPAELKNLMNQDSRVVINHNVMKAHPVDRREEFAELYEKKLKMQI